MGIPISSDSGCLLFVSFGAESCPMGETKHFLGTMIQSRSIDRNNAMADIYDFPMVQP